MHYSEAMNSAIENSSAGVLPVVLIVDDSETIVLTVTAALRGLYTLHVAGYAAEAIGLLDSGLQPDIILLDINLPDMDGFDLCSTIKARDRMREVPIMFITSSDDVEVVRKALGAGAVDLVRKPINFVSLRARISHHVSHNRQRLELIRLNADMAKVIEEFNRAERELMRAKQRELEFGSRLQKDLLFGEVPAFFGNFELATHIRPSRGIGGDLLTFTRRNEDSFDILIGDVMGKGVTAALMGAGIKTTYRKMLLEMALSSPIPQLPPINEIFEALRDKIFESLSSIDSFAAILMIRLNIREKTLSCINAGMPPALLYRPADNKVSEVLGNLMPIGIERTETISATDIDLAAGDTILLYSDGLTDQSYNGEEMYGEERLLAAFHASASSHDDAAGCLDGVLQDVVEFSRDKSLDDDQTALLLKVL